MGGNRVRINPNNCGEFCKDLLVWYICVEGRLAPLMESLVGHDLSLSAQFANSWKDRRVTMGDISFEVNEEVIVQANGMLCTGNKYTRSILRPKTMKA